MGAFGLDTENWNLNQSIKRPPLPTGEALVSRQTEGTIKSLIYLREEIAAAGKEPSNFGGKGKIDTTQ